MSKEKLCVIIPIYKDDPDDIELISIRNTVKSLDPYPVFFAAPEGIKMDAYSCVPEVKLSLFPARYFESIRSYNNLMLDPFFYKTFNNYEYMLIVQPDAYIIGDKDKLEYFLNMDYDYIGAPWKDTHRMRKLFFDLYYLRWNRIKPLFWIFGGKEIGVRVGNGGLSLRKIGSTIKLLRRFIFYRKIWGANEDVFFANFGNRCGKRYRIAPVDVAERFSLEETAPYRFDKTDPPFGVHDWEQYLPELKETMGTDHVVFLRQPQNHEVRPHGPRGPV